MEVSVIIPVYNVKEEYLRKCFDSVLAQTISDIEIIIIDDGSTNGSGKVCDEYALLDNRVKVFHQTNSGAPVCRNIGIDKAIGNWITFVDSDDWLDHDYIEVMLSCAKKEKADVIITDCFLEYRKRTLINHFYDETTLLSSDVGSDRFILQYLCPKIYNDSTSATDSGVPWGKLYYRSLITDNNIRFDEKLKIYDDNIFNMYVFEKAEKIMYSHRALYHYRKSTSSICARYNPKIIEICDHYISRTIDFILEFNKGEDFCDAVNRKLVFILYVIMKLDTFNKFNPNSYRIRKNELLKVLESERYKKVFENVKLNLLSFPEKLWLYLGKRRCVGLMGLTLHCKNIIYRFLGR